MKQTIEKVENIYNKIEEYALVYSLAFAVGLVFIQVVMRYVFNQSLSWSEELCRYIFIWQVWFGASLAFRRDEHIAINLIKDKLKGKSRYIYTQIGNTLTLLFNIFFMIYGFKLVNQLIARGSRSSGMRIPLYIIYLSVPLSALVIIFRLIKIMSDEHNEYVEKGDLYGIGESTAEEIEKDIDPEFINLGEKVKR